MQKQYLDQQKPSQGGAGRRLLPGHRLPLDMDDIQRDWDKPIADAGLAAKTSLIMRVGALDLGAGTGSFRVREMMNRVAEPLGVDVRADVNLTDIEATCTDGHSRLTEVVDLPTTGVNTERIWLMEHFADWLHVKLHDDSLYHSKATISVKLMERLSRPESRRSALRGITSVRAWGMRKKAEQPNVVSPGKADVDEASALSHATSAHFQSLTVRQAHQHLDLIERRKPLYDPWLSGLASAVACMSFAFLLGGGLFDMIGVFIGAGLGQWLRRRLFEKRINQFFVTFIVVALAALACVGTLRLIGLFEPSALRHDTAYIGAMLFVIPGFPLITGGLDVVKLDFPSGLQRFCYTSTIILMATLSGWMVASMVHLNPQGFESWGVSPWLEVILRFLAAFVGVWGFSMLSNSPQRMCLTAAVIGAFADLLKLTMTDYQVPAEATAFLGALTAGLLASFWRSSVRHGLLPAHLGYPRICLTVPAIVIMVPGMYMYRAMFYLGQFDIPDALNWGFQAFMVLICLPFGLAMARVVTDRNWRYEV